MGWQKRSHLPAEAEDAPFALCSCGRRRVTIKLRCGRCKSTPDLNLFVPPRCAARGRQRCGSCPTVAAEPFGDAGCWRDCVKRRAIRCWSGLDAVSFQHPERSNSAKESVSSCKTLKRFYALPRNPSSNSWPERSRCGRVKALWKTSDQTSLLASARKLPACGCASCRSPTKTARHFATGPSIWKLALSGRRLRRSCVCRGCSEPVLLASCAWGTRRAKARSRQPVIRPAGTSASRGGVSTRGRLTKPCICSGWSGRSSRSSPDFRPRWLWLGPPT